uniref:Uncharacterized protein n=1 Tax=Oryza meridionalis TaxID=40149 RepID=A0A0E0EI10_9ORYZ
MEDVNVDAVLREQHQDDGGERLSPSPGSEMEISGGARSGEETGPPEMEARQPDRGRQNPRRAREGGGGGGGGVGLGWVGCWV